jgi:hypothetical protein
MARDFVSCPERSVTREGGRREWLQEGFLRLSVTEARVAADPARPLTRPNDSKSLQIIPATEIAVEAPDVSHFVPMLDNDSQKLEERGVT